MKERTGFVWQEGNVWRGKVTFTDPVSGKRCERWVTGKTKTEARNKLKQRILKLEAKGLTSGDKEKATFADLATAYRAAKIVPAEFIDGHKVTGLKNTDSPERWLKMLEEYFGETKVSAITPAVLETFHRTRIATKTKTGTSRKIATLNRELQFLSRVLNYAVANGYIERNPFSDPTAKGLIQRARETKRERVLTFGEEMALLAACIPGANEKRGHLRQVLILACDTGLRRGELLTLDWQLDVNLAAKQVSIRRENSKTGQPRTVALTPRALTCLQELYEQGGGRGLVFGGLKDPKRAIGTARRLAGITDFHLHDARHTFITRCIFAGIPPAVVVKSSGHASDEWQRYLNVTPSGLRELFRALPGQDESEVRTYGLGVMRGLKETFGFDLESWLIPTSSPHSTANDDG